MATPTRPGKQKKRRKTQAGKSAEAIRHEEATRKSSRTADYPSNPRRLQAWMQEVW